MRITVPVRHVTIATPRTRLISLDLSAHAFTFAAGTLVHKIGDGSVADRFDPISAPAPALTIAPSFRRPCSASFALSSMNERGPKLRIVRNSSGSIISTCPTRSIPRLFRNAMCWAGKSSPTTAISATEVKKLADVEK